MNAIWVISPFSNKYPDEWERIWRFNLAHGIASLGFRRLGNCKNLDLDTMVVRHRQAYPDWHGREYNDCHQVARFYSEIQLGDLVLTRRGTWILAGIGRVITRPYYDDQLTVDVFPDGIAYPNHIGVDWQQSPRDVNFGRQIFGLSPYCAMEKKRFLALAEEFNLGDFATSLLT